MHSQSHHQSISTFSICAADGKAVPEEDFPVDDESELGPVPEEGLDRASYSVPSDTDSVSSSPRRLLYVRRNDPYAKLPSLGNPRRCGTPTAPSSVVIPGFAHQPLIGRVDFVYWPEIRSQVTPPASPGAPEHWVTLAQVKFEMKPAQVRWVLWRLAGVVADRVVATGSGTFRASFRRQDDAAIAAARASKKVLFDHHGMWMPSSPAQQATFTAYHVTPEFRMRSQRLPREFMRVNVAGGSPPSLASPGSTPEILSPASLHGGLPPPPPPAYSAAGASLPGPMLSARRRRS